MNVGAVLYVQVGSEVWDQTAAYGGFTARSDDRYTHPALHSACISTETLASPSAWVGSLSRGTAPMGTFPGMCTDFHVPHAGRWS